RRGQTGNALSTDERETLDGYLRSSPGTESGSRRYGARATPCSMAGGGNAGRDGPAPPGVRLIAWQGDPADPASAWMSIDVRERRQHAAPGHSIRSSDPSERSRDLTDE